MRIPKNRALSIGLTLAGIALGIYQFATYSGLYRLASDLQTRFLGFYLPFLSILPLLLFLIPGQLTEPEPAAPPPEEDFPTFEQEVIHKQTRLIARIGYWIPITAFVASGLFVYALTLPASLPAPVAVDSAARAAPPTGVPVTLAGTLDSDHVVTLQTRGARGNSDASVAPLASGQVQGAYRYFVDLGHSDAELRERSATLARTGRIEGTLHENGLNGEMRASFETDGIRIAEPHFLLMPNDPPPRERFNALALLVGAISLLLGLIALNARRLIAKHRRRLAEMQEG